MKIKKDDNVIVISGKDKGKTGKVTLAIPSDNKIVVAGINIRKIHKKPKSSGQKGQIIDQASPFHVSNVMFVDPKTNKPTRLGVKMVNDKKVRITQKSKTEV
ncbi:MAG: 50S ribosomal protein L24 [Candidatus Zambryskibacteria bacterium CG_4_9_14_3_um_filter_40_16]|uniref:Large ribosomal subunit protein uL24 n=2 Tax=Candidatus Zambryskiibacteriota TaxID=1817925 RepID=A0A2H0K8Q8_9BACT|nr:MAG: 50S ribosomal protein L24 [Candidatus Zambryskibacteria bacterium CG11_big_fil_rev_8_21_14_0_20_40_24]PJA33735.1 MAG: 50S ribosomal protein L24 [Candidatus Zambryskibacteria bacterium CG_4_9_14_3_um_filter_40_16]